MLRPYEPLLNIVPEGWGVVGTLGATAGLLWAAGAVAASVAVVALLLPAAARFCADCQHGVPSKPRGVLSPADGVVVHRRECHDAVLGREAIRVVLRLSWWGAYCLRAPIAGEVVSLPRGQGGGVSRLRGDDGQEVVLRGPQSLMLGAAPVMVPVGQRVGQGRRCGLRRLAREIEVLIPAGARVEVMLGQRVRSGETLLATLMRKS